MGTEKRNKKSFSRFIATFAGLTLLLLITGCGGDPAKLFYTEAEKLVSEGYFEAGIEEYYKIIDNHPDSNYAGKSYYKIGLTYHKYLGRKRQAIDAYSALFYLHPKSPEAKLAREDRAKIFSSMKKHRRAIEDYDILLQTSPQEKMSKLQYLIAMEYISMNDFMQARIELGEILNRNPDKKMLPDIHYKIATTYHLEGSLDDAIETYEKVITDYPRTRLAIEARLQKGITLGEAGYFEEAIGELKMIEPVYVNHEALIKRIELLQERLDSEPTLTKWERKYLEKDAQTIAKEDAALQKKDKTWKVQRKRQLKKLRAKRLAARKLREEKERKTLEAAKVKEGTVIEKTVPDTAPAVEPDAKAKEK